MIHLTRLQAHLEEEYADLKQQLIQVEPNLDEQAVRTRLLLGFALHRIAGCPKADLRRFITDGTGDRGVDAFYYDRADRKAFIFQSKFVDRPSSSPICQSDAQSFTAGVDALFSLSILAHGNERLRALREDISGAVSDPGVDLFPVLVSTSDRDIAPDVGVVFSNSFAQSMGDPDSLIYKRLSDLYELISPYGAQSGSSFPLTLNGFNMVAVPFSGYYGWVTGTTLAELFRDQGVKLFAKNLRSGLSNSDINDDMYATALQAPDDFWYFNNGVTFIADRVERSLRGGAAADNVALTITNGSIVNGAQTTSTLERLLDVEGGREALTRVKCLVRIVEISGQDREFSTSVTRFNNSQNGIGVKDFVSLDAFQQDLRRGLDRDFGVNYIIRSGEEEALSGVRSVTLQEATIALVVCGKSVENAVRAKDKISSLWRDTTSEPYTTIFNPSTVTPLVLLKAVDASMHVDAFLEGRLNLHGRGSASEEIERERAVATHGNRLFAYYVLGGSNIYRSRQDLAQFGRKLRSLDLNEAFALFVDEVFERFGTSYKAPLFKNRTKCAEILAGLPVLETDLRA